MWQISEENMIFLHEGTKTTHFYPKQCGIEAKLRKKQRQKTPLWEKHSLLWREIYENTPFIVQTV